MYLCCLTYLIIAGLHHILSLYFTVFIHFDEYWICFFASGMNKYKFTYSLGYNYSKIMFKQRTVSQ